MLVKAGDGDLALELSTLLLLGLWLLIYKNVVVIIFYLLFWFLLLHCPLVVEAWRCNPLVITISLMIALIVYEQEVVHLNVVSTLGNLIIPRIFHSIVLSLADFGCNLDLV